VCVYYKAFVSHNTGMYYII